MQTLLLGYGDIAQRTARLLVKGGHSVTGFADTPTANPLLMVFSLSLATLITNRI